MKKLLLSFILITTGLLSAHAVVVNQFQFCTSDGCSITYNLSTGTNNIPSCAEATLIVEASGDLGGAGEIFEVFGEGSTLLGTGGATGGGDCQAFPSQQNVYTITAAQYNAWNNDGTVTIILDADPSVNDFCTISGNSGVALAANVVLSAEDDAGAESTPTCSDQTFLFGYGQDELFASVNTNTYYEWTWTDGSASLAGFCGNVTSGSASSFTSNQSCWFSGTTGSVQFYANVANGSYSTNSATLTYRYTQPTVSAGSDQNTCSGSFDINPSVNCSNNLSFSKVSGSGSINSSTGLVTGVAPNSSGTFRATVTNGTCLATDDIVIFNRTPTTPSASGAATICTGGSATITALGSSASGGFTYYLQTSSGGTSTATPMSPSTSVSPGSTTTYYVRARSSTGSCWSAASNPVTISVVSDPSVYISGGGSTSGCVGLNPSTLSASVSGGTGSTTYTWQQRINGGSWTTAPGSGNSSTYNPPSIGSTGTYDYRVLYARSGSGCGTATSNVITFTVDPDASITASYTGPGVICEGGDPSTISSTLSGGSGSGTYVWEERINGGSWGSVGSAPNYNPPVISSPGTYEYRVQYVDPGAACADPTSNIITITVVADPVGPTVASASPGTGTRVCEGSTVNATFNAGSGGVGCSDQFQFSTSGPSGPWTAYTPGNNITVGVYGTETVIRGRRAACSAAGCTASAWTVLASWDVEDIIDPTVTCPSSPSPLALDGNCEASVPNYIPSAVITDNCNVATTTQSPAAGSTVSGTGSFAITITATDDEGNNNSCVFFVEKRDLSPPSVTCPAPQTVFLDGSCEGQIPDLTTLPGYSVGDNCFVNVVQTPSAGTTYSGEQTVSVQLFASDGSAFTPNSTCNVDVTFVDNTPPTVACQNITISLNAGGNASIVPADVFDAAGSADNCQPGSSLTPVTVTPNTFDCTDLGPNTVTLTVEDDAGNAQTCNATVTVNQYSPTAIATGSGTFIGDCVSDQFNNWLDILDPSGDVLISINDQNQDLGLVSVILENAGASQSVPASGTCAAFDFFFMGRQYTITTSNAPTGPVGVRLYFTSAELSAHITASTAASAPGCTDNDDVFALADLVVTRYPTGSSAGDPGGVLLSPVATGTQYGGTYVEVTTTTFSEFFLHGSESGAPLPVELLSFDASAQDELIRLDWATASELDNAGFEVQRSTDGIDFSVIGWVDGNGTTNDLTTYRFDDEEAQAGVRYYYRLKQVDTDGDFDYSPVATAMLGGSSDARIAVRPNPVTGDQVFIDLTNTTDDRVTVRVFDVRGAQVLEVGQQVQAGPATLELDVTELSGGMYTVVIERGGERQTRRFVVNR